MRTRARFSVFGLAAALAVTAAQVARGGGPAEVVAFNNWSAEDRL